jgi:flavodoxin
MGKKVLVIYYSQSGQLADIADGLTSSAGGSGRDY